MLPNGLFLTALARQHGQELATFPDTLPNDGQIVAGFLDPALDGKTIDLKHLLLIAPTMTAEHFDLLATRGIKISSVLIIVDVQAIDQGLATEDDMEVFLAGVMTRLLRLKQHAIGKNIHCPHLMLAVPPEDAYARYPRLRELHDEIVMAMHAAD